MQEEIINAIKSTRNPVFIGVFDSLESISNDVKSKIGNVVLVKNNIYVSTGKEWIFVRKADEEKGNNVVLDFINGLTKNKTNDGVIDAFSNGYCYWFARILKERFNGEVVYNPIANHFACKIGECIYDIKGCICTSEEQHEMLYVNWEKYKNIEPSESARIYRDCIMKLSSDDTICYSDKTCNGIKLKVYNEEEELK